MRTDKKNRISHVIRQRTRELRKSSTPAEQKLWQALRNRNLGDYKFRRQHPIGPYISDFFCAEVGLVVEVDGGGHLDQIAYDQDRTTWLESQGYHVIRFYNDDVLNHLDDVAQEILNTCEQLMGQGKMI
jgi:very-short-patch-repair endonuclease